LNSTYSPLICAQQPKKPFTIADDIEVAHFGDPYTVQAEAVRFSPDGNYFLVDTERGRLDLNIVEDSLRFYRAQDVTEFLDHIDDAQAPSPLWVVSSSGKKGPIVNKWRWLADSSGVAYLERASDGNQRLVLADLRAKTIEPLTSSTETVRDFDVRDRQHYVYTVADATEWEKMYAERQASAIVGTGRSLFQLLFPQDALTKTELSSSSDLWAVVFGRHFKVKNDGAPLTNFGSFALSPDGTSLVTTLPLLDIPSSWETLYPPPYPSDPLRIQPGSSRHQFVRIDLQTGSVHALTDAPTSYDAGSWSPVLGGPSWSSNGEAILLPGTFLSSKDQKPSRPCVAIVDLASNTCTCVEALKGRTETGAEEGYHLIKSVRFTGGDKQHIMLSFYNHSDSSIETIEYQHTGGNTWELTRRTKGEFEYGGNGLQVTVKQGLNEPPLLVGANKQSSRVIWDPNPQLKSIELTEVDVYRWKDREGRDWKGGLYKPGNYKQGQRYPLVIQTHGFVESAFTPSGVFPTAFAARALAAAGIVVLQADGRDCPILTVNEGSCFVSGYQSAANQLVSEGLVDPERIGIIAFSRTCFYAMEMLTTSSIHLKAASITDGIMYTYSQYMLLPDRVPKEANPIIGASPFGDGLQQWLKRSPGFNLDKVTTPLLVVGEGPGSLLFMWEPYAGLRLLHKPVDLMMLNTDEHVLTNPSVRVASQGGSVDWFRFWLQDYEDPDPAKAEQYARWHRLRKLEAETKQQSD
jgi:dipeptidyl aminopeptidase/acylaminoacyl peptidase